MSELLPRGSPPPVSAFSPGIMGQLVACGPVEGQGQCWLAQGGQVPSSIFYPPPKPSPGPRPRGCHSDSRATSPRSLSGLGSPLPGCQSGGAPKYTPLVWGHPKVSKAALSPLPAPLIRDHCCLHTLATGDGKQPLGHRFGPDATQPFPLSWPGRPEGIISGFKLPRMRPIEYSLLKTVQAYVLCLGSMPCAERHQGP